MGSRIFQNFQHHAVSAWASLSFGQKGGKIDCKVKMKGITEKEALLIAA